MYERLNDVTLKSGEVAQAGVVTGPDEAWADRVETLLSHKGEMWRWGNEVALRRDVGIDACFYLLSRDGVPFANMMTLETAGVGVFGHVFTKPEERRKGAASLLMALQMEHFRERGGKALFLGTGFDSAAYHIYRGEGFESVEPKSGYMAYYAGSKSEFDAEYFAGDDVEVRRLDWADGPASPALFLGDFEGVARCVPQKLFGKRSTESRMIGMMREEETLVADGKGPRTTVAVNAKTRAVVGMASWDMDPTWARTAILDVYCHPDHWELAGEMLEMLGRPEAARTLAYSDVGWEAKEAVLEGAGFRRTVVLENRVPKDAALTGWVDLQEWVRE